MTKHSLLSLWSGLEGVKGTPRITKKASSAFFGKGKGQEGESALLAGDAGLRCTSSLGPGSSSLGLVPRVTSTGREGTGERITAGPQVCQGGSLRDTPCGLASDTGIVIKFTVLGTTRATESPKPHSLTPPGLPDSLSIPDLSSPPGLGTFSTLPCWDAHDRE